MPSKTWPSWGPRCIFFISRIPVAWLCVLCTNLHLSTAVKVYSQYPTVDFRLLIAWWPGWSLIHGCGSTWGLAQRQVLNEWRQVRNQLAPADQPFSREMTKATHTPKCHLLNEEEERSKHLFYDFNVPGTVPNAYLSGFLTTIGGGEIIIFI